MKVVYQEIKDCKDCPHNKAKVCMKLGRYFKDICFEQDCPLPNKRDIEKITHYINPEGKTRCCGNCKYWKRWGYNKFLKNEIGSCNKANDLIVKLATNHPCRQYVDVSL